MFVCAVAGTLALLGSVAAVVCLSPREADKPLVTIYMPSDCADCRRWANYLKRRGFRTTFGNPADINGVRRRFKLSSGIGGPHIATVDGMLISGFVPAREIHLLASRSLGSKIVGVVVHGKPPGAPGVQAAIPQPYTVFAIFPEGMMRPIGRYNDLR